VTPAHAQVFYAPSDEYIVPVATPVYAYRPVTVFSAPAVMVARAPVYVSPVIVTQPYVTYSNPVVFAPGPRVSRDRIHTGAYGAQVYDHRSRGPGYGHVHTHSRIRYGY